MFHFAQYYMQYLQIKCHFARILFVKWRFSLLLLQHRLRELPTGLMYEVPMKFHSVSLILSWITHHKRLTRLMSTSAVMAVPWSDVLISNDEVMIFYFLFDFRFFVCCRHVWLKMLRAHSIVAAESLWCTACHINITKASEKQNGHKEAMEQA